ncbi:Membrane associated serine protease, rhomboid family [Actinokineospora alba]|uniref:Membrane associated serine protease, rhomboid family n=1 Tax=Actinokineospora alba TaxID=504798 RepID=A0A1H0VK06_9PSEU|nr:rhomboid family intramembrane serine protease [Actinokineospora alba]TDP67658.1 membrane associated rhomboid family serine protease [Actinokineospora alba]SDJ29077.1 Membrane associated serine protease, rhomboid family [Actinokineospora alba]SDP78919.1 Membrane associated serine protease, rhomboid family [Actinokineospora alba]
MSTVPAKRPANRVLPPNLAQAGIVVGGFAVLLYLIEFADRLLPADLELNGIIPRSVDGLDGIIWSPLLHGEWSHLIGNSVPLLVFAFLAMANGLSQWIMVTATIWLVSGIGVWLTSPEDTITIGASGLCFGWLLFLLVRGLFNRSLLQLGVAAILFAYWGTTLLGVLPGDTGISWQGHLFGAIGGVLAAWAAAVADKPTVPGTFKG